MPTLDEIIFSLVISFIGFYLIYFLICLKYSGFATRAKSGSLSDNQLLRPTELFIRAKPVAFSDEQLPIVSFIVPVYNECKMVESRINNFNQIQYPGDKFEVVIVDGGSNDGTLEELENFGTNVGYTLKVVKQGGRKGFNSAVVDGFYQTTGEIIFITGAETQYAPNAVRLLVDHFADPEVGAVNGTVEFNNTEDGVSPKIEKAYRKYYDFIRTAESKMDTPFDIKGEIAAARRSICYSLVRRPEILKKGCIDACFSFQAKTDGFRSVYDPTAIYSEPAPKSLHESFKQQIRRAATLIQNLICFKNLMLKSKYGLFGTFIMPAHFMMLIVLPYLFLFSVIGVILLILINPLNIIAISLLLVGLIGIAFSQGIRAFFKVQVALVIATLKMLTGVETQKFERLFSAR